jgi:oxygen-independent coproporphyrinogen III oxidase
MPLGLYISVPFCRTKCTYCNFASDVFSRAVFGNYVKRLCAEIEHATQTAEQMGGVLDNAVDTVYLGGGTPTLLDVTQLRKLIVTIRQNFAVERDAEITMECAPGTLSESMLETLVECGANRVSLGVQSFIDQEAASVGRLHNRQTVLDDVARLRRAGITNLNVDLIAGLPHQTRESWAHSLDELIAIGVPHASVYMLEVDEDSRLGRELIAGGQKYHAHFVPDEDLTADLYETACDRLNVAGIEQYEISNFARSGSESRHNLKYWTRQSYLGFGVDAHSMLMARNDDEAARFSNPDSLEKYVACGPASAVRINRDAALEETLFLGLRLNRGINFGKLKASFANLFDRQEPVIDDLVGEGLLEQVEGRICLTRRGRLLSNEVFQKFIVISTT